MNVGRNPLQVSSLQPQSAMAKLLKRLVSVVLLLVSVSVTQISSEKVVRATALTCAEGGTCVVGDIGPGGGIIFYVSRLNFTSTSSNCNTECKYLEVAPSGWNGGSDPLGNLSVGIPLVGSHSVTIGSIVYDDWFLPSIVQLNQLCRWHRNVLPLLDYLYTSVTYGKNYECPGATLPNTGVGASAAGILGGRYLSSSAEGAKVWDQDQSLGYNFYGSNQHSRYIRPVRAFSPGLVVTYNSQSGSAVSAGSTTSGGSVSSSPGSPTRAGYSFSGWFAASTGGSAITFPYSHGQTSDFTLYAQWTISTYAVSFNSNDSTSGSVPVTDPTPDGEDLTLPDEGSLVKTGYTFGGWNTASDGSGTSYAAGAPYRVVADVTLFAKWTANSLTVRYDSQEGSSATGGSLSTTTGGTLASLPTTSRVGYTFNGWFTASTGGSAITFPYSHGQTSDFTLYAQWTISTYAVSFNGNGSTGGSVPVDQTKTHGIDVSVSSNTGSLVKTGYTFGGWNTAANGSGTSYAASATYGVDAAVTLYAKWTADSLTVTYNSQSGSAVSAGSTVSGGSITSAPVVPTRAGYVFTGWFTATSGGTAITFPYTHGQTASFTLYAQWSQASLHGISSVSKIGTITTTANVGNTFAVDTESSSVSLRYPANGLPADSVIDVYLVNDLSRARSLIAPAGGFVVSLVVAWLAADGSVPLMASGKPLSMTIANDTIKAGAKTYAIVGGEVTLLATASVNGSVTISITEDPEIVVVNPVVVAQPSSSQPSSSQPSSSQPSSSLPTAGVKKNPSKATNLLPQIPGATSKIAAILNAVAGQLPPKPTVFAPRVLSNGQIARIAFTPIQIKAPPANAPVAPAGAKVLPIGSKIEQSQATPTAPVSRVAAGESKATFGGQTIETTIEKAANGPALLSAGPATIALAGFVDQPAASNNNSGGSTGLTASSSTPLEIATGSFIASTPVQVWLFSTPLLLAETTVDENGNFAAAINLPSSLASGSHTLQIQGYVYASGGAAEVTANIGISITRKTPKTWSTTFPMFSSAISARQKSTWQKFVADQKSPELSCALTPTSPSSRSAANLQLFNKRMLNVTTFLKLGGCTNITTVASAPLTKNSNINRTWTVAVEPQTTKTTFNWVHVFSLYSSKVRKTATTTWTMNVAAHADKVLACRVTAVEPAKKSRANTKLFDQRNNAISSYLIENSCDTVEFTQSIASKEPFANRQAWTVRVSTSAK